MADLTTAAGIEAELAATSDYDVTYDVDKAKRFVAAGRRKAQFAEETGRGESSVKFNLIVLERQVAQAIAYVQANDTPSDARRLANPNVVHADFSTFNQYGGGSDSG